MALDEFGKVMDVCRSGQRKAGGVRAPEKIDVLQRLRKG